MITKTIMDDKRLNFNQPLLSVRRGSATAHPEGEKRKTTKPSLTIPSLPFYKSDMKSGPFRNPGVVPFKWEQIPGRPKDERKLRNNVEYPSEKTSQESVGSKPQLENDGISVADSSSLHKNAGEFKRTENASEENDTSVSEGENSTYVDAPDSLSHSESFLNCSVTGVSGLDGSNTKPTDTRLDPLARDLMMGRFLPAAKAVAAETPHFGSKKPPVVKEQPRYYYAPISLPQHPQAEEEEEDTEDEEEEEEDNYNDFGGHGNASVRLCGLLPRFCLLNSLPGMRDQVPRPLSSVRKIHKKPANTGAFNKTDKAIRDAVYERRRLAVYKKSDMRVEANRLKHELNELYPHCDSTRLVEASKDSKLTSQRKAQTRSPESLADMIAQEEPALAKRTIEKTFYIDSSPITEHRDSNSSSSESRTDSRGRNPSIDYSLHDMKDLYSPDNMISSQEELQTENRNDHNKESSIRLPDAGIQQFPKKNDKETTMDEHPVLPLPLPKSPSESWLSRALPSASSRNRRSYANAGYTGFRSSPVDPRCEAKSLRLQNKHFGLPALTPISEN